MFEKKGIKQNLVRTAGILALPARSHPAPKSSQLLPPPFLLMGVRFFGMLLGPAPFLRIYRVFRGQLAVVQLRTALLLC